MIENDRERIFMREIIIKNGISEAFETYWKQHANNV